jgi:hypothetical protein
MKERGRKMLLRRYYPDTGYETHHTGSNEVRRNAKRQTQPN